MQGKETPFDKFKVESSKFKEKKIKIQWYLEDRQLGSK